MIKEKRTLAVWVGECRYYLLKDDHELVNMMYNEVKVYVDNMIVKSKDQEIQT